MKLKLKGEFMGKIGLGVRLVCTSFLGFIGGVLTMSKHQDHQLQKIKEEFFKVVKELQTTKKLLKSKDEERIDELLKFEEKIKSLEAQLNKDEKTNDTTL
jgi:cob(I)alamin adenosyltransferase